MLSLRPYPPVLLSVRQARHNFRLGFFASIPFIGNGENNFSHYFLDRSRTAL
jgi:hypothetical protein